MHSRLSEDELAVAYELIAQAIDRAGAERESLLLAKLALALAARVGNPAEVEAALHVAEQGLQMDTNKGGKK